MNNNWNAKKGNPKTRDEWETNIIRFRNGKLMEV